jgi:hypothetical protein
LTDSGVKHGEETQEDKAPHPARQKKGMTKATLAKKKKKPASKPMPAPVSPSPLLWEGFGGKTKDR